MSPSSPSPSSSQPLLHSFPSTPSQTPHFDHHIRTYGFCKNMVKSFLTSRAQHNALLALISLDLLSIFADIIINLYQCDLSPREPIWDEVRDGLGISGLIFSCLFMLELMMSIWVFGFRYFNSAFHVFDATVIIAGFIVDVLLRGILEEIASLVVILRLWRFFKIVEEFSVGAQEQMDILWERIGQLEKENGELKKWKQNRDEEGQVGI